MRQLDLGPVKLVGYDHGAGRRHHRLLVAAAREDIFDDGQMADDQRRRPETLRTAIATAFF